MFSERTYMTDVPAPSRVSKSAGISWILGILGCLPITGLLAMLSGIVGFFRAGKPGVRGRWMAVVGGILGFLSTGVWAVIVAFGGLALFIGSSAVAPLNATNTFIRDLTAEEVPVLV